MDPIERRAFMQGAVGALAFTVGGVEALLTPMQAHAQGAALKVLTSTEAHALEAFAEALVPNAREMGIANFIDQQCSVPPHEALLNLRIRNAPPPFVNFYRAALTEIDRQCAGKSGKSFAELSSAEQREFITALRQNKHADWKGPAQGAVYGVIRDDAVDVVYGTVEGFERLGVPYMPHIQPKARW